MVPPASMLRVVGAFSRALALVSDGGAVVSGRAAIALRGGLLFCERVDVVAPAEIAGRLREHLARAGYRPHGDLWVADDDPWSRAHVVEGPAPTSDAIDGRIAVATLDVLGREACDDEELDPELVLRVLASPAIVSPASGSHSLDPRPRAQHGSALSVPERIAWIDAAIELARAWHPGGPGAPPIAPARTVLAGEPPRFVGLWREEGVESELPRPHGLVDPSWSHEERQLVVGHLRGGVIAGGAMGRSRCRLCGAPNGSLVRTDGTYVWPDGLAHYVDVHAVRLPDALIAHARALADDAGELWSRATRAWWLDHARLPRP